MNVPLSGNPFVDTGLGVIAALGGLNDATTLTLESVREVFGDGTRLAQWNSRLKTFTQVFGTNGPLFQKGYGYKKGIGPGARNLAIYQGTLKVFLDAIPTSSRGLPCEACAAPTDFDFAHECVSPIVPMKRHYELGPLCNRPRRSAWFLQVLREPLQPFSPRSGARETHERPSEPGRYSQPYADRPPKCTNASARQGPDAAFAHLKRAVC